MSLYREYEIQTREDDDWLYFEWENGKHLIMDKYDKSRCPKEEAESRFKQYIDIILDEKLKQ